MHSLVDLYHADSSVQSVTALDIGDVLDIEYPGPPSWSASGTRVAAATYEDDGDVLLVATRTDGAWSTTRYKPDDAYVTDFTWHPNADEVAVTTDSGSLYVIETDTETSYRLAGGTQAVTSPRWTSDGDTIACYIDGVATVLDRGGGTVQRLDVPSYDRFLENDQMFAWNDDGTQLAVTFVDRETTQVGVVAIPDGELLWRTTTLAATSVHGWLSTGELLLDRVEDKGTVREVVAVDIEAGDERVLWSEVDAERGVTSSGPPSISPDGDRIALPLPLDGWEHVHVLDAQTGERTQLTHGPFEDRGFAGSSPQWVDDDRLVFASNRRDHGQRHVFSVERQNGETTPLVATDGTNVYPRPSPGGDFVAYVHASRVRSPELRVLGIDEAGTDVGRAPERLTKSVVDDWPVDPIEPELVHIESDDGTEIPCYVVDPRDSPTCTDSEPLPAVVWVHGGPMRQMRDGWHPSRSYGLAYSAHQYFAQRGIVGLHVNYRGGIGYGHEFRQAITDGYGRDEMADIAAAAEWLADRSYVDSEAVGVWGLSYGGYAVLQLLGTHPKLFAVGVNLAGLADLKLFHEWACETKFPAVESSQDVIFGGDPWNAPEEWAAASPVTNMENYERPLYSFHGTDDRYVNVEQQDTVVDELLAHDKEFEAEYYPGEGHVYGRRAVWKRTLEKIDAAFDEHL
jgi:dipeptidyl aminopeptidase/acylaminoacyl peptidase